MEQLLNGKYEYEVPKMILSEDRIEKIAEMGEHVRGILTVSTDETRKIKGMVTVTNARIVVGTRKFTGTTAQISYGIDVTGMAAGDVCTGAIVLDTDIGEYQVPVQVLVVEEPVKTSRGEMHTLDDFVELFHLNPREAFRFYKSESFAVYLKKTASEHLTLYHGMAENPITYQHIEEFLIGIGKKEPVSIWAELAEQAFLGIKESAKHSLVIHRSGWGYLHIEVETEGDFIEVSKKDITAEDFVGSVYQLDFIIRRDRLYKGSRCGCIRLKTVYGTEQILITASAESSLLTEKKIAEKKIQIKLMQYYLKFCMNRLDKNTWAEKTEDILLPICQQENTSVFYRLYQVYVQYLTGDLMAARLSVRELSAHSFVKESLEARAAFLYLSYQLGLLDMERMDLVYRIRTYQQKKQESLLILLILLQLDEDVKRTPVKKVYYMENLYDMGCRSPILYLEAYRMLCQDMGYMRQLNEFWKSVIRYVAKEGLFTKEMALCTAHLSGNEHVFTKSMYQILTRAYEKYPLRQILDAICKLIMKGNPGNPEFFQWYELAVEQELKITRLYEYYIETMPGNYQKMLPQVIRMYFAYNNTLSDRKKAFIYANVIRNKEIDKHTYQSYQDNMAQFAREKLQQGKINEDYAVIYQEFIKEIPDQKMADAVARVLFTHRVYCEDKKICSVAVCHGPLKKERMYPCVDGIAYVELYTPDAKIIFQDKLCRRYAGTVPYNVQRLMDIDTYMICCTAFEVNHIGILLHGCEKAKQEGGITLANINLFQKISMQEAFSEEYQMQVRKKLLEYYALHAQEDTLDHYLTRMDCHKFAKVDKVLLIEVLISRGLYEKAFAMICRYGQERVSASSLVRLCSRMIEIMEYAEDEELLLLCLDTYEAGKYDHHVLSYLLKYYEGTLDTMSRIQKSGQAFYLDTYSMEERILIFAMFTRQYIPDGERLLADYIRQGGRETVILAYAAFISYGYYWKQQEMSDFSAELLMNLYKKRANVDKICYLALLKYFGEKESLKGEEEALAEDMLEEFQQEGLRLGLFQKLPQKMLQPYQLNDCIFIEEKANPADKVILHYALQSDDKEPLTFKSEPMKVMYQSVFSKEFILFYGEILTYYITIEHRDNIRKTEKTTVTMKKTDQKGRSRYQLINQMMESYRMKDHRELQAVVRKYLQAERLTKELFPLIK